jgi:CRP-like cAMP-binding protein
MNNRVGKGSAKALAVSVFRAGEQIISQGAGCPYFFVILSGLVVLRQDGRKIRSLGEQDIFGLESLLLNRPSDYAAEAVEKCRIAQYAPEVLDYLMEQNPRMLQSLLFSILRQLKHTARNLLESPPLTLAVARERFHFFSDGETIGQERESGQAALYRLVSTGGFLQVTLAGREIARISRPGEFFGAPLLPGKASVRSIGQSVVERYGAGELGIIIRDYPDSALQIMQTMIERRGAKS